ncbi:hypothetical protein G6F63_013707 [Rhizopus arrhizus]|nr:hypothetical protein G6F63_013707 [Rhizopus arrhizus]
MWPQIRVWQNTATTATPIASRAEDSPEASQRGTAEPRPYSTATAHRPSHSHVTHAAGVLPLIVVNRLRPSMKAEAASSSRVRASAGFIGVPLRLESALLSWRPACPTPCLRHVQRPLVRQSVSHTAGASRRSRAHPLGGFQRRQRRSIASAAPFRPWPRPDGCGPTLPVRGQHWRGLRRLLPAAPP